MNHIVTTRRTAGSLLLVLALAGVTIWSLASPTNATTTTVHPTTVLYLDLGASVSVGVQPTVVVPTGQPTKRGYSNRLVSFEASRGISMSLTELGCPGESIATMLHGPDPCYLAPDTQLTDAVAFLHAHRNATTLVTVDLGFNTLDVCFRGLDIDLTCVQPQLAILRQQLGQVLRTLTKAAGPHVTFVGVGHYNPYLTKGATDGASEVFAHSSVAAIKSMNQAFSQVYGAFNIRVADVATAFHENATYLVRRKGKEAQPANVYFECSYTWMCAPRPFGPNIHPNDRGYQAITDAIVQVLPSTFK